MAAASGFDWTYPRTPDVIDWWKNHKLGGKLHSDVYIKSAIQRTHREETKRAAAAERAKLHRPEQEQRRLVSARNKLYRQHIASTKADVAAARAQLDNQHSLPAQHAKRKVSKFPSRKRPEHQIVHPTVTTKPFPIHAPSDSSSEDEIAQPSRKSKLKVTHIAFSESESESESGSPVPFDEPDPRLLASESESPVPFDEGPSRFDDTTESEDDSDLVAVQLKTGPVSALTAALSIL